MTWATDTFQIEVPEIYQIEVTNACNMTCHACIRHDTRVKRPIGFLDIALVRAMVARGDFVGSYFVELQMYGEPLLHPQLQEIVQLVKSTGCQVGLSTNGALIAENIHTLKVLDFLTISVDSADRSKYEYLRPGYPFKKLVSDIDTLLHQELHPVIDLQAINFWDGEDELPGLVKLATEMEWNVTCRSVPDCFAAYQGRPYPKKRCSELCLNPFLSVSVQWDGDVVPCCFSAGKNLVYGNLYQKSLKEIWNTSRTRKKLIDRMMLEYNINEIPCKLCYMRSPVLFHLKMLMQNIRGGIK